VIAIPGDLLGIETISGTMEHAGINAMLHKMVTCEIAANVKAVPDMDALSYLKLIAARFSNAEIIDTTRRVAFDGSSRQPGFIVPSIRDALANGQPIDGLALLSALWARYCLGAREDGSKIEPNDPNWDGLQRVAKAALNEPAAWLGMRQYYGDLGGNTVFSGAFARWHNMIMGDGVEAALSAYANED
ncbi:MAG: mannitol dehydrogenase family protein, partial [Pseudomonadota bacterium]